MDPIAKQKVMRRLKRARSIWYDCEKDRKASRTQTRKRIGRWNEVGHKRATEIMAQNRSADRE